ncbi:MAG: EAL domain-containing protein [Lachnospiraceae bacterium]|nr:EAL domain-containing protein [Lachnospiraceae bacterium]
MSDSKKERSRAVFRKEQRFRKLRRRSFSGGIIIFIIMLILLALVASGIVIGLDFLLSNRIGPGYKGLPYVIDALESAGESEELVLQSLGITKDELRFAIALLSGVAITMLVIIVMLIINILSSIGNQRRMTTFFLTDDASKGHNWMWFLIKSSNYLRFRGHDRFNFAILDIDLVNYRNYCMCHSVTDGEKLLVAVDDILKHSTSKYHEFYAHYASSDFVALIRYTDPDEFNTRVDGLLSRLLKAVPGNIIDFHIGIKLLPATTDSKGRLRSRKNMDIEAEYNDACTARATLMNSDNSGIAFFDEKLVSEQKWNDTVRLSQAKALENEEFVVFYQPKYDPSNDKLTGAEALIRWNSPEYGLKGPGQFIPLFEKSGFITKIDHYMLSHVARDQKRWLDAGFKCVPVSVNISRAHFIEPNLAEQIKDAVDKEGCPHELIEIELTESAFFDDKKAMVDTIKRLKECGFAVSMDDFGSGYSSLNSLKDMPLDVLKLDAEFFRGETDDKRGEIVVSEAIRLAKNLNMRTVAEGVEVKDQVEFLAAQGCDMIQGYYYAKPMPGNEYEERMMKNVEAIQA